MPVFDLWFRPHRVALGPVPPRSFCGPSLPQQRLSDSTGSGYHSTGRVPRLIPAHSRAPGRLLRASSPRCSRVLSTPTGTDGNHFWRLRRPTYRHALGCATPAFPLPKALPLWPTEAKDERGPLASPQASTQSLGSSSGGWGLWTSNEVLVSVRAGRPSAYRSCAAHVALSTDARSLCCAALHKTLRGHPRFLSALTLVLPTCVVSQV